MVRYNSEQGQQVLGVRPVPEGFVTYYLIGEPCPFNSIGIFLHMRFGTEQHSDMGLLHIFSGFSVARLFPAIRFEHTVTRAVPGIYGKAGYGIRFLGPRPVARKPKHSIVFPANIGEFFYCNFLGLSAQAAPEGV